jgi:ribonuclease HI
MNHPAPHYLLTSEAGLDGGPRHWRFVLKPIDGSSEIEAADVEPDAWGERLDLLTVVRALESLDQPSWVTLIGCTQYVEQGVLYGLAEWKENGWRWECFGRMVPVRDIDLWQRMDRILQIHRVDCGRRRFDAGHGGGDGPHWNLVNKGKGLIGGLAGKEWVKYSVPAIAACCGLGAKMAAWIRDAVANTPSRRSATNNGRIAGRSRLLQRLIGRGSESPLATATTRQ